MECFCTQPAAVTCKIVLLDEQELVHEIQDNSVGQALLDVVTKHLNLIETAYFGLRYLDPDGQTHWLDPSKKLAKQLKGSGGSSHSDSMVVFYFGVKFYAADPCKLLEEITRYQFFLQVKQDILQGRLPVSFDLAAELGASVVQSELGDYDARRHMPGYVSEFRLLTNQSIELEAKIADLHKTLVGQLPSVAELSYLDKVKWLDMYGVDLHPVLGEDNVEYFLGLTPSGIIVLRNKNTVGNYYWPRISKIYFKGRYFMLRVTDKNNDESTYGFETPSKSACKHLWKCCIEHHAFFRLVQVSPTSPDIFALSSRFRYSGRTEKQAVRDAQIKVRTPPSFLRVSSRRYQRRGDAATIGEQVQAPLTSEQTAAKLGEVKYVSAQPAHLEQTQVSQVKSYTPMFATKAPDSPRSTRSAPWTQPHSRGLYNTSLPPSPRSVRSAGPRYRSSSVDSQSSNESRSCKRKKHLSRITSDNESELSKSSGRSHRKHRRHRSRNRRDSGSEHEGHAGQGSSSRRKSQSRSRKPERSDSHYELVDSESQWRAVQQRKLQTAEGNQSNVQRANVVRSRRTYQNQSVAPEEAPTVLAPPGGPGSNDGTLGSARGRRARAAKSTDGSSNGNVGNKWLSDELRKHLEFKLIDTAGMSDSQLREIPYTVVQTNQAKAMKIKASQHKTEFPQIRDLKQNDRNESPPPPYTPHGGGERTENRRTGIRTSYKPDDLLNANYPHSHSHTSAAALSLLPRIDQLSIDAQMSKPSSIYGTSNHSNPFSNGNLINLGNHNDNGLPRIHHEHTDSGLGGEDDRNGNPKHTHEARKSNRWQMAKTPLPPLSSLCSDSRSVSLEYVLTPLIRSYQCHRQVETPPQQPQRPHSLYQEQERRSRTRERREHRDHRLTHREYRR